MDRDTVNGFYRTKKRAGLVETLKREDLLNYFKRIDRECRREISSEGEDYKNTSTDFEQFKLHEADARRREKSRTRPSSTKVRSSKIILPTPSAREKKELKPFGTNRKTSDNYANCSCPLSLAKNYYGERIGHDSRCSSRNCPANSQKLVNGVSKVSRKNVHHEYRGPIPTSHEGYYKEHSKPWQDYARVMNFKIANKRIVDHSRRLRNNVTFKPIKKNSEEDVTRPLFTKQSADIYTKFPSTSEYSFIKGRSRQTDASQGVSKLNDVQPKLNVNSVANHISIEYDFDTPEILRCEELLKHQERPVRRCNSNCACERKTSHIHALKLSTQKNSFVPPRSQYTRDISRTSKKLSVDSKQRNGARAVCKSSIDFREGEELGVEPDGQLSRDNGTRFGAKKNILVKAVGVTCKNNANGCGGSGKLCKLVNTRVVETERRPGCREHCCSFENVDKPDRHCRWRGSCKAAGPGRFANENRAVLEGASRTGRDSSTENTFVAYHGRESTDSNLRERTERFDDGKWMEARHRATNRKLTEIRPLGRRPTDENDEPNPRTFRGQWDSCGKRILKETDVSDKRQEREASNLANERGLEDPDTDITPAYRWLQYGKSWDKIAVGCEGTSRRSRMETEEPRPRRELISKRITTTYPSCKELSFEVKTSTRRLESNSDSPRLRSNTKAHCCNFKVLLHDDTSSPRFKHRSFNRTSKEDAIYNAHTGKQKTNATCCCSPRSHKTGEDSVKKLESFSEKVKAISSDTASKPSKSISFATKRNPENCFYCNEVASRLRRSKHVRKTGKAGGKMSEKPQLGPTCVRIVKPRESYGKANLKKILIFPPVGERGPPLTLYKNASNIKCKVRGDEFAGFRYNVTYVQKFVSPAWHPGEKSDSFFQETGECACTSDYG